MGASGDPSSRSGGSEQMNGAVPGGEYGANAVKPLGTQVNVI
jgi:hypothetical protein